MATVKTEYTKEEIDAIVGPSYLPSSDLFKWDEYWRTYIWYLIIAITSLTLSLFFVI